MNFNNRNIKFMTTNTSNYKIGKNIATNRLVTLNNKTSLNELPNFKIKIKALFLNLGNG